MATVARGMTAIIRSGAPFEHQLAAAVLLLAVEDARAGCPEARAWLRSEALWWAQWVTPPTATPEAIVERLERAAA